MAKDHAFMDVRSILMRDWDPIMMSVYLPDDEYDQYIPGVIRLLESNCGHEQLANYLLNVEKNWIEMEPQPERAVLAAKNLITAWKAKP
jgi:hypothetical protein